MLIPTATRPTASDEENKRLVHAWAHQLRRELPATHPAQATLTAVIRHNYVPSFPVAKPLEFVQEAANRDTAALVLLGIGAACLVTSGAMYETHPLWAIPAGVVGLVCQTIAFSLAETPEA